MQKRNASKQKNPYRRPKLTVYGNMTDLTLSTPNASTTQDNQNGNPDSGVGQKRTF